MFCPKCGMKLPDGSKFCAGCGNKLPEVAVPTAPVTPAPAVPVAPAPAASAPKKKSGINWPVLIILLVVGALLVGIGAWILISGLENGFDNIFGDGTSQSDDDDDDDDDDDEDRDDDEDDDQDEDPDDNGETPDDPKDPEQTGPQHNTTVPDQPEPSYPDYTDPTDPEEPSYPDYTEPESESWYYNYVDGLALYLPDRFHNDTDPNFFTDGTIHVTVMRLTIFDLADAWLVSAGSLNSAYSVAQVFADMNEKDVQFAGESCYVEFLTDSYCFIQGYFVMNESVWQVTVRADVLDEMIHEDMVTVLEFAEVEG